MEKPLKNIPPLNLDDWYYDSEGLLCHVDSKMDRRIKEELKSYEEDKEAE